MEPNLLIVCIIAFIAVMLLLSFLAVVMSLITRVFPVQVQDEGIEPGVVAAIQSVVAQIGAVVTHIEEK